MSSPLANSCTFYRSVFQRSSVKRLMSRQIAHVCSRDQFCRETSAGARLMVDARLLYVQQSDAPNRHIALRFRGLGIFGHWIRSRSPLPVAVGDLGRWARSVREPARIRCIGFLPQIYAGHMRVQRVMTARDIRPEVKRVSSSESCPRVRCISAARPSQPAYSLQHDCVVADGVRIDEREPSSNSVHFGSTAITGCMVSEARLRCCRERI